QAVARGEEEDHPQVEGGAVQLRPVKLGYVERVGHRYHLRGGPSGVLAGQPRVMVADTDHLVNVTDPDLTRVMRVQLEAVQVDEQPGAAALVAAVPDGVRAAPPADHHARPFA